MNIVAIIQARMASSRLPGKVLMDIEGETMLARVYHRTGYARRISARIVATTTDEADDALAAYCSKQGMACFRGHPTDVLDRYYKAATESRADCVVRITADCPLIDPGILDLAIGTFQSTTPPADLIANRLPDGRTYPVGLDVEVVSYQALKRAWEEAILPHQREHVLPFIYEQPNVFRVIRINHTEDAGQFRWTVDEQADLELVREIFRRFQGRNDFSWLEVLRLFEEHPELSAINADVRHKTPLDVDARREEEGDHHGSHS